MTSRSQQLQDRLVLAGLVGAGVLTVSWWAVVACGVYFAIEWVAA